MEGTTRRTSTKAKSVLEREGELSIDKLYLEMNKNGDFSCSLGDLANILLLRRYFKLSKEGKWAVKEEYEA